MASSSSPNIQVPVNVQTEIRTHDKVLILMRGIPGSGKSSLATKISRDFHGVVQSADSFFINRFGMYDFRPELLTEAHANCQKETRKWAERGVKVIIVDNTNLESWEMEPYAKIAKENGYHLMLVEPTTPWRYDAKKCSQLNSHGIPWEKIEACRARFEKFVTADLLLHKVSNRETTNRFLNHHASPPSWQEMSRSNQSQGLTANQVPATHVKSLSSNYVPNSLHSSSSLGSRASQEEMTSKRNESEAGTSSHLNKKNRFITNHYSNDWRSHSPGHNQDVVMTNALSAESSSRFHRRYVRNIKTQTERYELAREQFSSLGLPEPDVEIIEQIIGEGEYIARVTPGNVIKLDKSTETDLLEQLDVEQKLSRMREVFPDVGLDDQQLRSILEACNMDHEWALALISDMTAVPDLVDDSFPWEDMIFEDEDDEVTIVERNDTQSPVKTSQITQETQMDTDEQSFPEINYPIVAQAGGQGSRGASDSLKSRLTRLFDPESAIAQAGNVGPADYESFTKKESEFQLRLDPNIAFNLEKAFGEVLGHEYDNLQFSIPRSLAKQIYDEWVKQAQISFEKEIKEKEGKQITKQMMHTAISSTGKEKKNQEPVASTSRGYKSQILEKAQNSLFATAPASQLDEIRQLEQVLERSREDNLQRAIDKKDTNEVMKEMSKSRLHQMFPGFCKNTLDDLLEDNEYDIAKTAAIVETIIQDKPVVNPSGEYLESLSKTKGPFREPTEAVAGDVLPVAGNSYRSQGTPSATTRKRLGELRSELSKLRQNHTEILNQAKGYYDRGKYREAAVYRERASDLSQKCRAIGSTIISEYMVILRDCLEVDLHGFNVADSLEVVKQFLEMKEEWMREKRKSSLEVVIITGYGKVTGYAKIKPSVQNYLETKRYKYHFENKGSYRVFLTRN